MQLSSTFVFATLIVQFLYFLNPKFQASNNLWVYSLVCVGTGQKLRRHFIMMYVIFLAHLGDLIVYPWSAVRLSTMSSCPQCSNISETAWPIKAKFYVEPPWVGGTQVCSRHLGHMAKMAATPIYVRNPSKIFFGTGWPISTNTWHIASGIPAHHSLFK